MGTPAPERRTGPRYCVELQVRFEGGEGVTRDVSLDGICFLSTAGFKVRQTLDLSIVFMGAVARAEATVLRLESAPAGGFTVAARLDLQGLGPLHEERGR